MSCRDYSVVQKLQTAACTDCRLCVEACPAVAATGQGELSPLVRLDGLRRRLTAQSGLLHRWLGKTKGS